MKEKVAELMPDSLPALLNAREKEGGGGKGATGKDLRKFHVVL